MVSDGNGGTSPYGRYDVVTLRLAVGGLVACGLMSVAGIVGLAACERATPASLGHIATGVAGALSMCFGQLFNRNGNGKG